MAKAELRRTTRFIELAVEILNRQWPMTIRQLFYQMVGLSLASKRNIGGFENDDKHYKLVSRMLTKAREDGRVDYAYIVDRSRPTYAPNVFDDVAEYSLAIKRGYRKDYWVTQPFHVELWVEKDAVVGSIEDTTDELGVSVRVGRGFQSTTRIHEIAKLFNQIQKPKKVFYLGDHDPSGRDIERDLRARLALKVEVESFSIERIAIHKEDIRKFRLPPLRIKGGDSRAMRFKREHGENCVELDALPPEELRRRIRRSVTQLMDMEKWERAIQVEAVEIASIEKFARMLGNNRAQL